MLTAASAKATSCIATRNFLFGAQKSSKHALKNARTACSLCIRAREEDSISHILKHDVFCPHCITHCLNIVIFYNGELLPKGQQVLRDMVENHRERNEVVEQQQGLINRKSCRLWVRISCQSAKLALDIRGDYQIKPTQSPGIPPRERGSNRCNFTPRIEFGETFPFRPKI